MSDSIEINPRQFVMSGRKEAMYHWRCSIYECETEGLEVSWEDAARAANAHAAQWHQMVPAFAQTIHYNSIDFMAERLDGGNR